MRAAVKRDAAWSAALPILAALAAVSSAAAGEQVGEDRWVPGLALTGGATFQNEDGSVASWCEGLLTPGVCQPERPLDEDRLRPAASGSDRSVSAYVGASLQLMSPAIPALPGRPRLFLQGEFLPSFPPTRNPANEGEPSGVRPPTDPDGNLKDPKEYPESQVTGTGSRTRTEMQPLVWGAGIGIAFPFELRGRQLRLKPSAGWIRYEVEAEGVVAMGLKDDYDPVPVQPGDPDGSVWYGAHLRTIDLRGGESLTLDAIGPGLEIEMDATRWGPVGISLFLGAQAYRVLGETSLRFSESVTLTSADDIGPPGNPMPDDTYTAEWSVDLDPWIYRVGVGLRFHWLGN